MAEGLTEEQIGRAFAAIVGASPRPVDVEVVGLLGGTVEALAEYLWDHWLGEPDSPSLDEVELAVEAAIR